MGVQQGSRGTRATGAGPVVSLVLAAGLSGCLMDTYLWPPVERDPPADPQPVDIDGDGFAADEGDCDDLEPAIGPHAPDDDCNGVDDDCDGEIDQSATACEVEAWFEQTMRVDVLVVIDDTISMHDLGFVGLASAGASTLLEPLRGPGMYTHIGVITSDMVNPDGEGRLQEAFGRRWITGTSPVEDDLAISWLQAAILGDGVGVMHPPPAPKAAIEAAVFDEGEAFNNGFFRADASLAVLLIGDQDDPSDPAPNELIAALRAWKAGTGTDVTFYAITQDDTILCEGDGPKAVAVLELVDQTEGMHDSICRSEYGGFMSGVGQDIAINALGSVFRLPEPADLRYPVSVWIVEPDGDAMGWVGFSFRDPWTMVFDPRPPAGSDIKVTYREDPRF